MSQSKNYQVAVVIESTPNTYEPPVDGDSFDELADIPTFVTDQEEVERTVVRGSLGQTKSRRGSKIGTNELSLELKSSNSITTSHTNEPRLMKFFDLLLGSKITTTANAVVSGGGSTDTVIDTDVSDWAVGEVVLINDEVRHVESESGAVITLNTALVGAPLDTDVIFRGHTAKPNSADARRASVTSFDQPVGTAGWEQQFIGCAIANGTFNDITNGSIPKVSFNFDSVDWEVEANVTNAITPTYEDSTPPDNLGVYMVINEIQIDSNNFSCTIDKEVTPKKVITNKSGIQERVATARKITGSFDYYPSDTDSTLFDNFEENDTVDMQITWFECDVNNNPIQGTIISMYLPNVQLMSGSPDDEDGFIKRTANFNAFETNILDKEIFVSFL